MKIQNIAPFIFILLSFPLLSQNIRLIGQISIHNSKYNTGEIVYVENAYVSAAFTSPDDTDNEGIFHLDFVGVDSGTSVALSIEKNNLEVVNKRDLQDVVIGRKRKVYVFLAPKGELAKAQTELYNISKKALYKEYDRKIAILEKEGEGMEAIIANLNANLNLEIRGKNEAIHELKKQLVEADKKLPKFAKELAHVNLDFSSDLYIKAYELYKEGKIDEAIATLDDAQLDKAAKDGLTSIEVGEKLIVKGELQIKQVESLRKMIQSNEKDFGKKHFKTAITYSNLATILKDLGDYEGAKKLYKKIVQSDEKNFGKNHTNTAISYSKLAEVLQVIGDYKGAKKLLQKAHHIFKTELGENHPNTESIKKRLNSIE